MEIRLLSETDDPLKVSRIYALSWKHAYQGIVPPSYLNALREDFWVPYLSKKQDNAIQSIVAVANGTPVGTSSFGPARDSKKAGWGEIVSLYLLPEYQGKGAGGRLLETAMNQLKAQGFFRVYLWVLEENQNARRFYEKHGFSSFGDSACCEIGGKELKELRYQNGC